MATATLPSLLVDEKRAAEILGISAGTLSVWRCTRRYPLPYTKIGRAVQYQPWHLQESHPQPHSRRRRGQVAWDSSVSTIRNGQTPTVDVIKAAATGRWVEILTSLGGVAAKLLDGRHHPCPKCGGKDRFRMIDIAAGALIAMPAFPAAMGTESARCNG